jgi:hypothetical protein
MQGVNKSPNRSDVRTFGLVMLVGFGVIGAALWYFGLLPEHRWWPVRGWGWNGSARHATAVVFWGLGVLFTVVCQLSPRGGRVLYIVWMTGAMYLGTAATTVLLSVLFAALLPFFSLIRLADPLRLKRKSSGSCWEEPTPHEATLERTRRQF